MEENVITLKVGDTFRMNQGRKKYIVAHSFEFDGDTIYIYYDLGDKYKQLEVKKSKYLCGVTNFYGNVWGGIAEVNDMKIRGVGGKLLAEPKKPAPKKTPTAKKPYKELTDFDRFVKLQKSGKINMTDVITGSRMAGISVDKYEDIMWHYDEYKSGIRK